MGPLTRSEQLASPPGERAIAYLASHRLGFGVDEQRALPWWATRLFVDREFAMSAKTAGYSVNHHKLGPGDLWHTKGLQLPAYIQNIAAALERDGHSRSSAISIAVGTCRRWASGGGKVSPEVRAAAAKALTEWEAAKAKAHATSHSSENPMSASLALALFDPAKHPRGPKGASNGGKFAAGPARNASAAAAQKDKGAAANADAAVGATDADAKLKALSDQDLQALSRYAYSFKSADPKVVALRIKIANQLKSRGMDVNNYGGLGKPSGAAAAKTAAKPAKKTAKNTAKAPPKKKPATAALSHPLALATPMTTSGDGPKVTLNADQRRGMARSGVAMKDGSFPIPDRAHLHKAIKAVGRAHPAKRAAVRAHIRRRAKALGVPVPDAAKGAS